MWANYKNGDSSGGRVEEICNALNSAIGFGSAFCHYLVLTNLGRRPWDHISLEFLKHRLKESISSATESWPFPLHVQVQVVTKTLNSGSRYSHVILNTSAVFTI